MTNKIRQLRLWVDGQCLQTGSRNRGIGRYVLELCRAIVETRDDVRLLISLNLAMPLGVIDARKLLEEFLDADQIFTWRGLAKTGQVDSGYNEERASSEDLLRIHVSALAPDVALSASPFEGMHDAAVPYVGDSALLPWCCISYDFIPARFSTHYLDSATRIDWYRRRLAAIATADLALAISDFVTRESQVFIPDVPCVPIYAGVGSGLLELWHARDKATNRTKNLLSLPSGTILYVGGMDWRKNVSAVVHAISLLPDPIRNQVPLAVVGEHPQQLLDSFAEYWSLLKLPEANFLRLGRISDEELIEIYRSAALCIQPSFSEGFGLNVLEAMTFGVPTICADVGSLPEVVDNVEALFDPNDAVDLSQLIFKCVVNQTFTETLAAKGVERSAHYSWRRTAGLCVDALRQRLPHRIGSHAPASPQDPPEDRWSSNLTRARTETLQALRNFPNLFAETIPDLRALNRRLLIDVSATSRSDGGGGIQRVVKAMARNFVNQGVACDLFDEVWAIRSDDGRNFFVAEVAGSGFRSAGHARQLTFGHGDTVLLPDSSWPNYVEQEKTFTLARAKGAKIVSVVYDVLALTMPGLCNPAVLPVFAGWFQAMLCFSDAIMCNTEANAAEIMQLLTALDFRRPIAIGHWPLGNDIPHTKSILRERTRPQPIKNCRKFLLVGTLEARKGHAVALTAFEHLWRTGNNVELIIVGKIGWGTERLVERLLTHPELGTRLQVFNHATDEQLVSFYREADALLAPSFAEGFGLPIVEAAHFELPVFASDIAVFREVADSATAFFFPPGDSESLAKLVEGFAAGSRADTKAVCRPSMGLTWRDSAEQLSRVAFNRAYQFHYTPRRIAGDDDSRLQAFEMRAALPQGGGSAKLVLFDSPTYLFEVNETRFLVHVTNQSNCVWSSRGDANGALGINLGCKIGDESAINTVTFRASFPLIVAPGRSCVLEIRVPSVHLRTANTLKFELVQEGVAWWGAPLVVDVQSDMLSRPCEPRSACQQAIFVDISELAQRDVKTGIQRVTRGMVRALIEVAEPQYLVEPVFATTASQGYAHELKWSRANLAPTKRHFRSCGVAAISGDIFLVLDLCPTVLFAQDSYLQMLRTSGVKVCAVVYDLLPIQLPWAFPEGADAGHQRWFEIVSKFDTLVCISLAVANEVRTALRLTDTNDAQYRGPSVVVLPLASDTAGTMPTRGLPSDASVILKKLSTTTTFLMVGTIEPRKGHQQVLDAFELLWADGFDGILVIVGKTGWNVDGLMCRIQQHQHLGTRLFHLNSVSDEYLEKIYSVADCLIAASYGEGFGLPIAEAQRHRIPVLARDIPVFREVACKTTSFFAAASAADLLIAIRAWLRSTPQPVNACESDTGGLTWRDCARELLFQLSGERHN